jgi:ribosomal protein S27AE
VSLHPNCPQCGMPPRFEFDNQSFCENTSCFVITWNPNTPYDLAAATKHSLADFMPPAGTPSITCPRCGATSYNPNDIQQGYCGRCHDWTREG